MGLKQKQLFRVILGAIIIGGSLYVSIRYLMKGPAFIKVGVLLANVAIVYLVIDFIIKRNKKDKYGA